MWTTPLTEPVQTFGPNFLFSEINTCFIKYSARRDTVRVYIGPTCIALCTAHTHTARRVHLLHRTPRAHRRTR